MIRNKTATLFLFYLLITSFGIAELFVSTSHLTLLPNSFYYVYESSVKSIVERGDIEELSKIFDNFASSPGTIILLSSLNVISGLNTKMILNLMGALYEVVYLALIWLFIKALYNNLNLKLILISVISSGVPAIVKPIFDYGSDTYVMLILLIFLLIRNLRNEQVRYSDAFMMTVLTISMLFKYLPMGLFLIALLILVLTILRTVRMLRMQFVIVSAVIAMMVLAYFIYMGMYFYADFRSFIFSIIKYLKFETVIYVRSITAQRTQLDALYSLLYMISLSRFFIFIPITFYSLLLILYRNKTTWWKFFSTGATLVSILGSLLYITGFLIYVFVSSFTDYGTRIFSLGLTFYVITVYSLLLIIIQYARTLGIRNNLLIKFFNFIIVMFVTIAFVGSIITPISRMYFEVRGLDLSTQYKYGYEALFTSSFIAKFTESFDYKNIIASYRYIYLTSLYGIDYYDLRYIDLKRLREINAIIILPTEITTLPDSGFGPLPKELVQVLFYDRDILFNSGMSVILI